MKTATRRGFTLVELLVVITIIGILIALLLPAVQASREAARRIHCANNLAQVGLALQNYEGSYEMLPPGVVNPKGPIRNKAEGYHMGWLVQILPYIEEGVTYRHIDFSAGVYDNKNRTVRRVRIRTFLCPSDSANRPGAGIVEEAGVSNYAGCHHDVEAPIDRDNHGVLFLNSRIGSRDVSDGTSHTIYAGEKVLESGDLGWMSGTPATLRNTGAPPAWWSWATTGASGSLQGPADEASTPPTSPDLLVGGFSSSHPGGANFTLGDGSVRFVSSSINPTVFQQLGHRCDGKLLTEQY